MIFFKKIRSLENEIINRSWKIISRSKYGVLYKKLIAIDYFDLEISILDNKFFFIRNFLNFSANKEMYFKLFIFVNALNKLCAKGFFIIDEKKEVIFYRYNLQLESNEFNDEKQLLFNLKIVLDEIEILSKKLSFGIHQILFSNYEIDQIKECVLTNAAGNA